VRLAVVLLLLLLAPGPARGQRDPALDVILDMPPPVPLGKITRRQPYVPPAPPAQEAAPAFPADWRPTVRPAEDPAMPPATGRLRYVPMPGIISCSINPAGEQVCGAGYWFADDRR
jgi:hypothetical protein